MATFTESFNKADGSLGPDLVWEGTIGTIQVVNQQATSVGSTTGYSYTNVGGSDQTVAVTFASITSLTGGVSLYARTDDPVLHHSFYTLDTYLSGSDYTYDLYPSIADPIMFETAVGPLPTEGQTLTFEVIGSSLRVLLDDVVIHDVDNTEIASGDYAGFAIFQDGGVTLDNFSVVTGPSLGTQFMPPSFGRIPTTVPYPHPGNALQRNYRARQEGTNVYLLSNDTVTETDPDSITVFWHSYEGSPYVKRVFWGSTADPYDLTIAEAQVLTDAGYTLT